VLDLGKTLGTPNKNRTPTARVLPIAGFPVLHEAV